MKHRFFLILCFLGMCMPILLGMAEPAQKVLAAIDGGNADRVHLRAVPSYYDQYLASFPFEKSARAFYGIGVIDTGAAESVNLREFGDDTSPSWGEYYTGTKAVCVSDPDETWVSVWIGNETGVIHRNNLCFDTDKAASHPFRYGEVLNDTLLSADSFNDTTPTFAGEEHLKKGQMIILLGRTSNGHYLADSGKGWGYVRCDSVKTVNELSQN